MNSSHTSVALCILLLAVIGSALSSDNREAAKNASSDPTADEVSVSADDQEVAAVEWATKGGQRSMENAAASPQTP